MADARLQQLRRWEHADLETQVRLLRERMRAGELSEERIRLATFLGDEASRVLCPSAPSVPDPADPSTWIEQLQYWGREAQVRAALGVAYHVLGQARPEPFEHLQEALGLISRTVTDPGCDEVEMVDEAIARSSMGPEGALDCLPLDCSQAHVAGSAVFHAIRAGQSEAAIRAGTCARESVLNAASALGKWPGRAEILGESDPPQVWALVQVDLVPWALGLRDPLAERVAARKTGDQTGT